MLCQHSSDTPPVFILEATEVKICIFLIVERKIYMHSVSVNSFSRFCWCPPRIKLLLCIAFDWQISIGHIQKDIWIIFKWCGWRFHAMELHLKFSCKKSCLFSLHPSTVMRFVDAGQSVSPGTSSGTWVDTTSWLCVCSKGATSSLQTSWTTLNRWTRTAINQCRWRWISLGWRATV